MSNESKFWIVQWAIFCIAIIVVTLCTTIYWKDHNDKIVELIEKGVDPVAIMCAMQDDHGNHPTCIVLAAKRKE